MALLSHELNFLQGAGCIGDVLPSSVRHKNLRQRQISWDIPDLGDIWYCVKKYRQSVLVMQELLLDSVYEGQELFEEVKASEGTYTSLLSKFKTLYPMEYSKLDAHTPLTELYSTLISNWTGLGYSDISEKTMELRMSLCPQESMIHFDENSLPKLPPTLGKFTVMIASAAQVRRCASQHCAPTEEQLQHARASTVRGVHVNVEAIEWREVIAVISTGATYVCIYIHIYICCNLVYLPLYIFLCIYLILLTNTSATATIIDGYLHALQTVEDYDMAMPVQSIPLKVSILSMHICIITSHYNYGKIINNFMYLRVVT